LTKGVATNLSTVFVTVLDSFWANSVKTDGIVIGYIDYRENKIDGLRTKTFMLIISAHYAMHTVHRW
jgi:hypothetical protein